jgi:hypothetical protein
MGTSMTVLFPGDGPRFPERNADLDDEIEDILSTRLDTWAAIDLRNQICDAIAARGFDIYARPLDQRRSPR